MNISHKVENISLSAGEISELFNAYLHNSGSICVLSYFEEKAQDPDIKAVIKTALDLSYQAVEQTSDIFRSINHPIPQGFTSSDVNLTAPMLYSDKLMMLYVRFLARFGLTNYSEARACCARSDVRDLFNQFLHSTIQLFNMSDEVLLNKGIFEKQPSIPIPKVIDVIEKQSFLSGFFGEKRSLNAIEINRLYLNFNRNSLGKAFLIGLCQTTNNQQLKEYFLRGKDIAQNHMKVAGSFLQSENLPIPNTHDSEVSESTTLVFSDKLMLFHIVSLIALGLQSDGITFARVMRRDISLAVTRLMSEIALYAEDGFNILIENGWFERVPQAADRRELLGTK